jgi:hypothetical protein
VVGRRGEIFGVKKKWKKYIYAGREDGIFVHPENGLDELIRNWCIGGCWFTPAGGEHRLIIIFSFLRLMSLFFFLNLFFAPCSL